MNFMKSTKNGQKRSEMTEYPVCQYRRAASGKVAVKLRDRRAGSYFPAAELSGFYSAVR